MTNPAAIKPHLVQTSPDFSIWTTRTEIRCEQCSEGAGQVIGDATLVRNIGRVAQPGEAFATVTYLDLLGMFVRVLIQDDGGIISVNGNTWSALWHGTVAASSVSDLGGGSGTQTITCNGLAGILEQLCIGRGAEYRIGAAGPGPSNVVDPGYMPPFNRDMGKDSTDDQVIVGTDDGPYVYAYAHQRSTEARFSWTAGEALDHILKLCAHGEFSPAYARLGDLRWDFTDASGCLDYFPQDVDLFGGSVLKAINTLINPRRGLIWRLSVSGTTATIVVQSTTPQAITAGGYTLPAAASTHAPVLTGGAADGIAGVDLSEDASACYDVIEIVGAQPWVGMTVAYVAAPDETTALGKGWTEAQESAWDDGDTTTKEDRVWRRFALRGEWTGQQYDLQAVGLRNSLTHAADGSTDGERTHDTLGAYTWQPETLKCTRTLPCGVGFVASIKEGYQDPLLFIGADGDTLDLNGAELADSGGSVGVTVEETPGAVVIGHQAEDANQIAAAVLDGSPILATIGIRESAPLRVRWVRSSASWPRSVPRVLTMLATQYEQWLVLPGTITGTDGDGNYVKIVDDPLVVRDDLPAMRQALSLLRSWYSEPARTLRYVLRGIIDRSSNTAPGVLVTSATLGIGTLTINAPYIRRVWDLTPDGYGTSLDTARVLPDLEALR